MRTAFIRALERSAESDPRLILVVGDLGYGVIENFSAKFPKQFINAGISEQNMAGMAAGLASTGRLVFMYSIANFPTFRCLEQIRNDIAYTALPVVIVSVGAGFSYGTLGYSHHAIEDMSVMRALPGMRVLSPADALEVEACMDLITTDPRPTYLRLGKNGEGIVHEAPIGSLDKGLGVHSGEKVLVLATGPILGDVARAVAKTDPESEIFELVSVPMVKPLGVDPSLFLDYSSIVTVEEHSILGGLATAVLEALSEMNLLRQVIRLGISENAFRTQGSHEYLKESEGLSLARLEVKFLQIKADLA